MFSELGHYHCDTNSLIQKHCSSTEKAAMGREFRQAQHPSVFTSQCSKAVPSARVRMRKEQLLSLT